MARVNRSSRWTLGPPPQRDPRHGDPERRERFARGARAIAALNHPHIVTIHSVEEANGEIFLTMEIVEGRSLADVLLKGALPLDRLLKVATAVADAIAAAHQKGIAHRDLKPANVMLGDGDQAGRVKVLDFGLAKTGRRAPRCVRHDDGRGGADHG